PRVASISDPLNNERVHVLRQVGPTGGTLGPSEFTKVHQHGNTAPDVARGVLVVPQPLDVLFNRSSYPRSSDALNRCWQNEVVLKRHCHLHEIYYVSAEESDL